MEAAFLIQRDTRHRGEFNGNLFFLLVVGGGILSSLLLSPGHHFILVTIEPCEKVIELAKEALSGRISGSFVKEIYVPGKIVNFVVK